VFQLDHLPAEVGVSQHISTQARDVQVGTEIPPLELTVDPEKMKVMTALLADPNPIHFDPRALAALGMPERTVNQGPLNMGYLQTMLARWAGGRDRLLSFQVRFRGNVLAGDRVRAQGTVTAIEDTERGRVATCDISLVVVGGAEVLTGTADVIIEE
jgi:acyl dehydratase